MMAKGISIYLGMDSSLEDVLQYIRKSSDYGFTKLFTSLHIPEVNYAQVIDEFKQVVKLANELQMSIIADISPNGYQYLGFAIDDLLALKQFGLSSIRLDFGFTPERIAKYSNNEVGLLIELNASSMTFEFLEQIVASGANLTNLSACHNYYPRINTGISLDSLRRKNSLFKQYAIPVSAFVALQYNQRPPFYEGLPTVESTRKMLPIVAGQLLMLAGTENIFIADELATDDTLKQISLIEGEVINLPIDNFNYNYLDLFNVLHTNRPDSANDVIRSQESRLCLLENINFNREIAVDNCLIRSRGSITIDNLNYARYSGELQICKCNLPADNRVNVIGNLHPDALILLDYIGDNQKFRLI